MFDKVGVSHPLLQGIHLAAMLMIQISPAINVVELVILLGDVQTREIEKSNQNENDATDEEKRARLSLPHNLLLLNYLLKFANYGII